VQREGAEGQLLALCVYQLAYLVRGPKEKGCACEREACDSWLWCHEP